MPLANKNFLTLICVYAPTTTYPEQDKEAFYEELGGAVDAVSKADRLLILVDVNARVGSHYKRYDGVVGKSAKVESTPVVFCCSASVLNGTCISLKCLQPSWPPCLLLDAHTSRKQHLKEVFVTWAMRGTGCSTDYYMIRAKVELQLQAPRRKSSAAIPKMLDVAKLNSTQFCDAISRSLHKPLLETLMVCS